MIDLCEHCILIENFFHNSELTLVFGCEIEDLKKQKCKYPARLCVTKIQWEELYNLAEQESL